MRTWILGLALLVFGFGSAGAQMGYHGNPANSSGKAYHQMKGQPGMNCPMAKGSSYQKASPEELRARAGIMRKMADEMEKMAAKLESGKVTQEEWQKFRQKMRELRQKMYQMWQKYHH